jgi:hypothetical protein
VHGEALEKGQDPADPLIWHEPMLNPLKGDPIRDHILEEPSRLPWVAEGPIAKARELVAPGAGRIDVALVDPEGRLTLIECKLGRNQSYRRRVIGQLLSYAGALWGMSYADFAAGFAASEGHPDLTAPFREDGKWELETFANELESNLGTPVVTLVFAVDVLTEELAQTIAFLDGQTSEGIIFNLVAGLLLATGTTLIYLRLRSLRRAR